MSNIFRISDGLGNQLFQYAFAYSMYQKTGTDIVLDPMYSGTLRRYQLDAFKLDFSKKFINTSFDYLIGIGPKHAAKIKLWYRDRKIMTKKITTIRESDFKTSDEIYRKSDNNYFIGFWQSYKYFDQFYDDIKRQFVLKKPLSNKAADYANKMRNTMSVSLHIRRTDYNRAINNVCLSNDFYLLALNQLKKELNHFSLFVFTDDKEFVRKNLNLTPFELVEGVTDLEEFQLMQCCKHHIIANSTFSWWAAYLSKQKGGIVYAPTADIWTSDFYLPKWNCIEARFIK